MFNCSYSKLFCHFSRLHLTFSRALHETRRLLSHYDTLQLKPNASAKEIKDAYLKLSKIYHPDKNPNDPKSHDRFICLQDAYQVLGNADSKKIYDAALNPAGHQSRSGFHRPYGYPNFSDRDQWIKEDKARRERKFRQEFRKQEDYNDFHKQYSQPHRLTPEEMEQFYRLKSFGKGGRQLYVVLGVVFFVVFVLELYTAKKKSKYYYEHARYDDPMFSRRLPPAFNLEYETEKLIQDEKYRQYLNREIEEGKVGETKR